jgi:saccharopine dehydrogenase-like NADP-dependent oxidoreductase
MQHVLKYRNKGSENEYEIRSSLILKGDDASHTAMARTVGLPLASASALLLNNKISQRGVVVPVSKEIYVPVLEEMKSYGIFFGEEHHAVSLSL